MNISSIQGDGTIFAGVAGLGQETQILIQETEDQGSLNFQIETAIRRRFFIPLLLSPHPLAASETVPPKQGVLPPSTDRLGHHGEERREGRERRKPTKPL